MSTLTDPCTLRLTVERATDVSPGRRSITNAVDAEVEERRRKGGFGLKQYRRGNMSRFLLENDKKKQKHEGKEVKDVG